MLVRGLGVAASISMRGACFFVVVFFEGGSTLEGLKSCIGYALW
jgi:hypothetical protein